ncbi:MAG: stilbene synthase [Verrucomicrobia bacterium]|nr:stilbene synthase [Verrucomicrobiota bacterium]
MYLIGLGTSVPPHCYAQRECWSALQGSAPFAKLSVRSRAILKRVLSSENGIATRHLALDPLDEVFDLRPDTLHARFAQHAPALAAQAGKRALEDARISASNIDAVLVSTCTGYLCPGLTSYVTEQLGLRADVFPLDLVGQGCGAALPNLRTAEALIAAGRAKTVLSICVEVCSAAFYLDDDPGVLISACLFGDGAGAAVLSNQPARNKRRVRWKSFASDLQPADRDVLRFEQRGGMLRNILTQEVPAKAAASASQLLEKLLALTNLDRPQIAGWIWHAGGRDVLQALREQINLSEEDVRHSAGVLRNFGNLSSPTVFFVLQTALNDSVPDGFWWMSSFGAGFSCHGALMEVRAQ